MVGKVRFLLSFKYLVGFSRGGFVDGKRGAAWNKKPNKELKQRKEL